MIPRRKGLEAAIIGGGCSVVFTGIAGAMPAQRTARTACERARLVHLGWTLATLQHSLRFIKYMANRIVAFMTTHHFVVCWAAIRYLQAFARAVRVGSSTDSRPRIEARDTTS